MALVGVGANGRTRKISRKSAVKSALTAGILACFPHFCFGTSATWDGNSSVGVKGDGSNWSDANNWTSGGVVDSAPPNSAPGDDITFGSGTVGTINLNSGRFANSLTFNAGFTIDIAGTPNSITDATGDVSVATGVITTFNGVFKSTSGLTLSGGGTLAFSNTNPYTGTTTIDTGCTLETQSDSNLGSQSPSVPITILGTLLVTANVTTSRNISTDGVITVYPNATYTVNGIVTNLGTSPLNVDGPGTLSLTNSANSFPSITVNDNFINGGFGGDVAFSSDAALGKSGGTIVLTNGTGITLLPGNTVTTSRPIDLEDDGPSFNNVTVNSEATLTLSGPIVETPAGSGPCQLVVNGNINGDGMVVLSGTNNYSGGTLINGILSVSADKNLGASSGAITFGENDVAFAGEVPGVLISTQSFSSSRAVTLGPVGGTFQPAASTNLSISGTIEGTGGGLIKTGAGVLTLSGTNNYTGGTTVSAGLLIASTGLPATGGGNITVNGGAVIFRSTSALTIRNAIKSGFNAGGGYWNGNDINSTAAAGSRLTALGYLQPVVPTTFQGQSLGSADVAVMYTYYGDADLSGTVDGADYELIDKGFAMHLAGWSNGDFNYDGVVDGSDYALIDNTFNQLIATGAGPLALIASPSATSDVPEPGGLALVGLGFGVVIARRRRMGSTMPRGSDRTCGVT